MIYLYTPLSAHSGSVIGVDDASGSMGDSSPAPRIVHWRPQLNYDSHGVEYGPLVCPLRNYGDGGMKFRYMIESGIVKVGFWVYLDLAISEDGAVRLRATQRVEERHEGLVLRLFIEFQVHNRLRKLRNRITHVSVQNPIPFSVSAEGGIRRCICTLHALYSNEWNTVIYIQQHIRSQEI